MTFPAGTRLGRYELLESLGHGRLSEVYRARDTSIGRFVAVKVLPASLAADSAWLQRFEQEARAVGQLDHPNILSIHDLGVHEGRPYLVLELLEGQTLRERLTVPGLTVGKAISYGIQVMQGIAAAHEKGIVHRDLKPENLFVTRDGRVKILDFGLAQLRPAEPEPPGEELVSLSTVTEPGLILGTFAYMSPEQVRAERVDQRSDIFSFGAILYEMATGQRAFRANSSVETMIAILREEPPPLPPAVSEAAGLDRVIRRCLEKNPLERFQSARDVTFALEDLLAAPPPPARATPEQSDRPWPVKRPPSPEPERAGLSDTSSGAPGCSLIFKDREVPLASGQYILGRGRDAAVRLHHKSVSRHHARIAVGEEGITIEDLRSRNGTYVRGERVESSRRLFDGDEIRLGSLAMTLRTPPSTATTETQTGK
jgi:serine/threonine protein kinase